MEIPAKLKTTAILQLVSGILNVCVMSIIMSVTMGSGAWTIGAALGSILISFGCLG